MCTSRHEDLAYVAGDCCPRWSFHLGVEHLEDLQEFWVLDNGERTVSASNPEGEQITESSFAIGRALGESFDALFVLHLVRIARVAMPFQVTSRTISPSSSNEGFGAKPEYEHHTVKDNGGDVLFFADKLVFNFSLLFDNCRRYVKVLIIVRLPALPLGFCFVTRLSKSANRSIVKHMEKPHT